MQKAKRSSRFIEQLCRLSPIHPDVQPLLAYLPLGFAACLVYVDDIHLDVIYDIHGLAAHSKNVRRKSCPAAGSFRTEPGPAETGLADGGSCRNHRELCPSSP